MKFEFCSPFRVTGIIWNFQNIIFFNIFSFFLLVTQLDAFGSNKQLVDTKTQLDRSHNQCTNLETQLLVKDDFYASREKDMHDLHQSELLKGMCSKTKITVVFFSSSSIMNQIYAHS